MATSDSNEKQHESDAAFPWDEKHSDGSHYHSHSGMTLRDYFAAQALGVIDPSNVKDYELTAMLGPHQTNIMREEIAAKLAYRVADAMLKAREVKHV